MADDDGTEGRRPKRMSSAKQKKMELLERMKNTVKSGKKNKYDVGEIENVYDEVDEREYSKKVLARQDDDWIVDDGGCGYVEDGRDIFDDDLDEESLNKSKTVVTGKKRSRDIGRESSGKGNIRNMIASMPSSKRKKEAAVKLDEDDILGDIIGEIGTENNSPNVSKPVTKAKIREEISARDYINSFTTKTAAIKPKTVSRRLLISLPETKEITLKREIPKEDAIVHDLTNGSHTSSKDNKNDVIDLDTFQLKDLEKGEEKIDSYVVKVKEEPIYTDDVDMTSDLNNAFSEHFGDDDFDQAAIEAEAAAKKVDKMKMQTKPIEVEIKQEVQPVGVDFNNMEWDKVVDENSTNNGAMNINIDKSKLPLTMNESGQEVLRFYYWDAHEEIATQPGTVYLFGKIFIESAKSYVSCCVTVKNIDRQIYLLPREKKMNLISGDISDEDVTMADVYEEFNTKIASKYKIKQFKSRKTTKKYAFGKEDIPLESEYLEVRYPAHLPTLPTDLKGETFSCAFGTRTSYLELLLLEQGIKGPCWLDIVNPEPSSAPVSWCKVESICTKPTNLVLVKNGSNEIPPIVLAVLRPQMVYNSKTKQSEVVAVGCLVNHSYQVDKPAPERLFNQHFCVVTRPAEFSWPFDLKESLANFKKTNVEKMESERALLNYLLTRLFKIDPDIIVGHDLSGFGIEVMVNRLAHHKVPNWSRLGRLKRSVIPTGKFKGQIEKVALTGRLMCDVKISAKELIRSKSYDLEILCQNVLHFKEGKREELTDDEFKFAFCTSKTLINAVWHLMSDSSYILRIFFELNIFPLALQITNIAGNVMSRTLMGGRSERNEFLLLHAFHSKGYILPDKEYRKKEQHQDEGELPKIELGTQNSSSKSSRKKPSYAGGLVLDPKVGFYDDLILLMDFNSLYPSIIQEYNICFTTIPIYEVIMDENFVDDYNKYFPTDGLDKGILPTEIRKLVESRKGVKDLLKNQNLTPDLKMQYDIRQMALKLTANSMYGCLGFTNSRFYAKPLAALVTAKGREILLNTKRMVETYGYDVIYGDTDSIMINTKTKEYDQVYQVGKKIKTEVNKCYRQVELDIDGVFKYMLLLKKKKYAAVTLTKLPSGELIEKHEMKGLDIVRRDWCQLAAEAGKFVLKQIFTSQSADDRIENIHGYLENIKEDIENGKVPISLLTVTKQLTKAPEDYADAKALPHVLVAVRMNSAASKRFKQGDTVSYIVCEDGTNNPATQRAYHTEELNKNNELSIDTNYYLSQQIHPVIARLCDPIEGTDAASIARCLGLDPTRYNRNVQEDGEIGENEGSFGKDDSVRFKDCIKFTFKCLNEECKIDNEVDHPLRKMDNGVEVLFLERCVNSKCTTRPFDNLPVIQNTLQLKVREILKNYGKAWMVCEDPICGHKTNFINPMFDGPYPVCIKCKQSVVHLEMSSSKVHSQLIYFANTFDITKATKHPAKFDPEIVGAYRKVHDQMMKIVNVNNYSIVPLGPIFRAVHRHKMS